MNIDGFDVGQEIGRGGFGVVYQARQLAFGRDAAIKVLHDTNSGEDIRRQFARECRAVGALRNHRNILNVYSTGTTAEGSPYLAMELLRGGSLADRIPLSVDATRDLGVKLAAALQVAHDGGVIHRDVKPGNVLFDDDDEPVLVDFGISAIVGEASTTSTNVALSLGYAPPEVLGGARPSAAADVYALGATLFAALSGRAPFIGKNTYTSIPVLAARILNEPVEDLRPAGVPDELCRVIEKAMAKEPEHRYATVAQLGEALAAVRGDDTVRLSDPAWRPTKPLPDSPTTAKRPGRRRRTGYVLAVLAAAVVIAGGVTAAFVARSGSPDNGSPSAGSVAVAPQKAAARRYDSSDLNCDGHDDFLAVRTSGPLAGTLLFYPRTDLNNGTGLPTDWSEPGYFVPEDPHFGATTFVALVTPGDMNGDGRPDLVGEKPDGSLWLMPGRCTGMFVAATATRMAPTPYAQAQIAGPGDLTGDGIPDLVAVYDSRLYLFPGTRHGTLGSEVALDSGWTSPIAVGDVNGDRHPDLVDRTADGSLHLYETNGASGFAVRDIPLDLTLPPSTFPAVLGASTVSLSDRPDLVAIDRQEMLVAFTPTGVSVPDVFSKTCKRIGGGWGRVGLLHPIANVTTVPAAPPAVFTKPSNPPVPACAA